jgi:hypothetical protein
VAGNIHVFTFRCRRRLFANVISKQLTRELLNESFTLKYAVLKTALKLYNFQFMCDTLLNPCGKDVEIEYPFPPFANCILMI